MHIQQPAAQAQRLRAHGMDGHMYMSCRQLRMHNMIKPLLAWYAVCQSGGWPRCCCD